MFALKWLLMAAGVAIFGTAAGVVAYDVYLAMQFQKLMGSGEPGAAEKAGQPAGQAGTRRLFRWTLAAKLFGWVWAPLPQAPNLAMVPEGPARCGLAKIRACSA